MTCPAIFSEAVRIAFSGKVRLGLVISLLLPVVLLTACDPGYEAAPVGWTEHEHGVFERDFDGLRIRTTHIGGLLGESWLDVDFIVTNATRPVTVKKIVLTSPLGRFVGTPNKWPWRFTAAEARGPGKAYFGANWQFNNDKALPDIIGEQVDVEVSFRYGSEPRHIEVTFKKSKL